jgi:gliding motility-associated-like protein
MVWSYIRVAVVFFLLSKASMSSAQYITTIIGNGVSACYLSDAPPLCIPLGYPESLCVADNGDIFFTCGNAVKKLSKLTGYVTVVAGSDNYGSSGDGGPAINALFQFTRSVRLDKHGDLYIAEYSGHRVRKINMATGIITTIVGTGNSGYSGDGGLAVNARINTPNDLAIDDAGNIFIADFGNHRVRRVDAATGIITTVAGTGVAAYGGDGGPAVNAQLPHPNSVCLDKKGNIYISEAYSTISCRIRKIDAITGIITTIAGNNDYAHSGDGGLAVNASLFDPAGVMVDNAGNVYIAQYDDSRIRKIDIATGIINTVAGTGVNGFSGDNGLAVNAMLRSPIGLAFDKAGDLYICDNQNLRIRKFYTHAATPPTGKPVITINSPTTIVCNGSGITFKAVTEYAVAGSYYMWTKNGNVVSTDSAQWIGTGLLTGDEISCSVFYPDCSGIIKVQSNNITITGNSSEPLSVSIAASKTSVCVNENVDFTATALNGTPDLTYQWKLNGNNVGNGESVYSNSTLVNGDVVSCEITAAPLPPCLPGGVVTSNKITIDVNSSLAPSINITASDDKICAGTIVQFRAEVQNGGNSQLFQWKLNGVNTGSNNAVYSSSNLADNDRLYCIVTVPGGCADPDTSNVINMAVESLPSVKVTPSDTTVSYGSQVQLQASVSGDVNSFSWTPATALNNSSSLSPVTVPLQKNAIYTLRVITAGNCADSATAIIKVEQKLFMPNAFTPNRDAKNDIYRIPPNVSIQLKNFSIYNSWGEKIFSTTNINAGWDGTVNNINQSTGTYIYVITGTDSNGPISLKGTFLLIR